MGRVKLNNASGRRKTDFPNDGKQANRRNALKRGAETARLGFG
jgi:hypothetical protein